MHCDRRRAATGHGLTVGFLTQFELDRRIAGPRSGGVDLEVDGSGLPDVQGWYGHGSVENLLTCGAEYGG